MPRRVVASGRSCLECRRRKIKCDRSLPCAYCVRSQTQCSYPPVRPNTHTNPHIHGGVSALSDTVESPLQGLDRSLGPGRDLYHPSQSSSRSDESHSHLLRPAQQPPVKPWQSLSFPFELQPSPPLEALHLPPALILFMWQTYLDVVDPVLKLFHVPSIQRLVVGVIQRPSKVDPSTESLMFAIYYSTVVTMSSAKCRDELHEEKGDLLKRYRVGVEHALLRANFLRSQDLTVLQAFVLYLTCGRRDRNGPDVCRLVGLAIGNAMKMGLHCDTPVTGVSQFQLELRRRVWWQICTLDVRVAEDHSIEPSILEATFNTELPLNVHDIGLDPNMHELPPNQVGRTEMLFSLVRFRGSYFARRVVFSDAFCRLNSYPILTEAQKCQLIDQFGDLLEEQYLSHCDPEVALDFVTAASIRLILVKLKLAVCKPTADQSRGTPLKGSYQKVCYEVLKQAHALRRYEKGTHWLWLFQTYVEWDAMAYLLLVMCIQPWGETIGEAWKTVDEIYYHWKNDPDIYHDRRWAHIEDLRRQALAARDEHQNTITTTHATSIEENCTTSRSDKTETEDNSGSTSVASVQQNSPLATEVQSTETIHLADQEPLIVGTASSAAANHDPHIPNNGVNHSELPGAGTTCEWSAALFEQYWEVAGLGEGCSTSWL